MDKTSLSGKYDFILEFAPDMPHTDNSGEPSDALALSTALQKQLGLQLIAKKLPFEILVIDSVDKMPVEN